MLNKYSCKLLHTNTWFNCKSVSSAEILVITVWEDFGELVGGAGGGIYVHVCVRGGEGGLNGADQQMDTHVDHLHVCTGDRIGLLWHFFFFWSLGVLGDLLAGKRRPPEERDKVSIDNSISGAPAMVEIIN